MQFFVLYMISYTSYVLGFVVMSRHVREGRSEQHFRVIFDAAAFTERFYARIIIGHIFFEETGMKAFYRRCNECH